MVPSGSVTEPAVSVTMLPAGGGGAPSGSDPIVGGWVGGLRRMMSRVFHASSRPLFTVALYGLAAGSTPSRMARLTCAAVAFGLSDQARAATPVTCGAAMLVPLL